MANYDYIEGKKRIYEIIDSSNEIEEKGKVLCSQSFTYENGYYSWVTAIFIDIRDSTSLFTEYKRSTVAKIVRAFTSEIIEILKNDDNLRDIGIRGDCVYAIYTTPNKEDDYEIYQKSLFVNTYMEMLNKILTKKQMPNIKAGIGISTDKELVVKAGRKDSGINDFVWIGNAVTHASKFSNMANKDGYKSILASSDFMKNIIEKEKANEPNYKSNWFTLFSSNEMGYFYSFSIVKTGFENWIKNNL